MHIVETDVKIVSSCKLTIKTDQLNLKQYSVNPITHILLLIMGNNWIYSGSKYDFRYRYLLRLETSNIEF